jgi:hypothetical protein
VLSDALGKRVAEGACDGHVVVFGVSGAGRIDAED